jgi:hypothetical protein
LGGLSFKGGVINGHLEKDVNYYAYTWQIECGLLEGRAKASTKAGCRAARLFIILGTLSFKVGL